MKLEPFEIIEKLLGGIQPVGATHIDTERYENLNNYEILIEQLVFKYARLIENIDRYEHSMKIVGERTLKFIKFLHSELGYYIRTLGKEKENE